MAEPITHSLECSSSFLDEFLAHVVFVFDLCWDFLEQLRLEDTEQLPCNVQGCKDISVLIGTLSEELFLEFLCKFEVLVLILAEGLLANNGLHGARVLPNGI